MLTNDGSRFNPQSVILHHTERLSLLIRVLLDTNSYIETSRRDDGLHWDTFDAGQISSYRRIAFIPRLIATYRGRDGIEDHKVDNVQLWLFDQRVAMYFRLGDQDGLRSSAPKLLTKLHKVVVAGTYQLPLVFQDLEDVDPHLDDIRQELRIKDLEFIVGIINPAIDGLIANFYIGTHVGQSVEHIHEVSLTNPTIISLDEPHSENPSPSSDESNIDDNHTATDFGDKDNDGSDDSEVDSG
jgi:hypothetical protein